MSTVNRHPLRRVVVLTIRAYLFGVCFQTSSTVLASQPTAEELLSEINTINMQISAEKLMREYLQIRWNAANQAWADDKRVDAEGSPISPGMRLKRPTYSRTFDPSHPEGGYLVRGNDYTQKISPSVNKYTLEKFLNRSTTQDFLLHINADVYGYSHQDVTNLLKEDYEKLEELIPQLFATRTNPKFNNYARYTQITSGLFHTSDEKLKTLSDQRNKLIEQLQTVEQQESASAEKRQVGNQASLPQKAWHHYQKSALDNNLPEYLVPVAQAKGLRGAWNNFKLEYALSMLPSAADIGNENHVELRKQIESALASGQPGALSVNLISALLFDQYSYRISLNGSHAKQTIRVQRGQTNDGTQQLIYTERVRPRSWLKSMLPGHPSLDSIHVLYKPGWHPRALWQTDYKRSRTTQHGAVERSVTSKPFSH